MVVCLPCPSQIILPREASILTSIVGRISYSVCFFTRAHIEDILYLEYLNYTRDACLNQNISALKGTVLFHQLTVLAYRAPLHRGRIIAVSVVNFALAFVGLFMRQSVQPWNRLPWTGA